MLLAQPISWVRVLYEVLHSAIPDEQVVAISCLVRLVQDGMHFLSVVFLYIDPIILDCIQEAWIENIRDRQQDGGDTSLSNVSLSIIIRTLTLFCADLSNFVTRIIYLLGKNRTEFYAAVVLRSVADDIHGKLFP